jgi:hypothetical protein
LYALGTKNIPYHLEKRQRRKTRKIKEKKRGDPSYGIRI